MRRVPPRSPIAAMPQPTRTCTGKPRMPLPGCGCADYLPQDQQFHERGARAAVCPASWPPSRWRSTRTRVLKRSQWQTTRTMASRRRWASRREAGKRGTRRSCAGRRRASRRESGGGSPGRRCHRGIKRRPLAPYPSTGTRRVRRRPCGFKRRCGAERLDRWQPAKRTTWLRLCASRHESVGSQFAALTAQLHLPFAPEPLLALVPPLLGGGSRRGDRRPHRRRRSRRPPSRRPSQPRGRLPP